MGVLTTVVTCGMEGCVCVGVGTGKGAQRMHAWGAYVTWKETGLQWC